MSRTVRQFGLLLTTVLVTSVSGPAVAGTVTYGWHGTLQARPGGEDPWSLGGVPASFYVEVTVPQDAIDVDDVTVTSAVFREGVVPRLWVNSEPLEFVELPPETFGTYLDFDGRTGGRAVSMQGTFRRGGVAAIFASVVDIAADSFAFVLPVERPPVFASTPGIGGESNTGTYRVIATAGALVAVVPELSSAGLVAIGFLTTGCSRRRRGS